MDGNEILSKKFYAVNKITRERWKPEEGKKQYLVMYDSGKLAVVTEDRYNIYINPLDNRKYETVTKFIPYP